MGKKVLIVGGVAGGASAAARLRRLDESLDIVVFEKGEYISFANCGLPYHIGNVIKDRDKLILQTPEKMKSRFNIDVRVFSEVTKLDTKNKKVKVNSKDRGIYEESFDYLILSPGGKAIIPNVDGISSNRIHTLKTIKDMDKIKYEVDNGRVKSAIVIGGGFIGIEAAENLVERGINVTLVEGAPHILAPFDTEMVAMLEKEIDDNGVQLVLNTMATSFTDSEKGITVNFNNGESIDTDLVILAIGVTPDVDFLKDSGLEFGKKGHILVNEYLETNTEGVYAVGDAIEVKDLVSGINTAIPLAGPANRQGRIVADNICGAKKKYNGSLGTSILKVFGLTGATTGNNERQLKARGEEYEAIYIHPNNHAGYYPDATQMSIKLLFNRNGKIFGAQGVGYDGVDKTIDVIATAITLKASVEDLKDLELAYAPPFNSAKSPANMLGFVAENIISGKEEMVTIENLEDLDSKKHLLLDIREQVERDGGYIPESIHIPLNSLRDRMDEIPRDKEVWLYCRVGVSAHTGTSMLKQAGFKVKNLTGGYKTYTTAKFTPTIKEKKNNTIQIETAAAEVVEMKKIILEKDLCGLCCPGPLLGVKKGIDEIKYGELMKVSASDPGFYEDIKSWCDKTNNSLVEVSKNKGIINAVIQKGSNLDTIDITKCSSTEAKDNKTIVVFSGDLDKAIASFIIANGAAAMGKKVTLFFTFWGINILRKPEKVSVAKSFMDKMFGMMMPKGSKKLKLSQMNMAGAGPAMIRKIMKNKNVSSLEELIQSAIESGVEIVACQMSMDLLGFKPEELIDGIKLGGVGYYLGEAEDSNVNLFI